MYIDTTTSSTYKYTSMLVGDGGLEGCMARQGGRIAVAPVQLTAKLHDQP